MSEQFDKPTYDHALEQIRIQLAGLGGGMQGAILADLVATWLSGHRPAKVRAAILEHWLKTMQSLVPPNDEILDARLEAEGKDPMGQPL